MGVAPWPIHAAATLTSVILVASAARGQAPYLVADINRTAAGSTIDSFVVRGLPDVMSEEEAGDLIGVEQGDRFDQIRLEAGEDSLVRTLREQGFVEAIILQDARRETNGPARVTLDVSPGRRFRVEAGCDLDEQHDRRGREQDGSGL